MTNPILRVFRAFIRLLLGSFTAAFGALCLALLVLSQHPLPLTPFVPWIQEQVTKSVPGLTFKDAKLAWKEWDSPFEVRFEGLELTRPKTTPLQLKTLGVALNLKELLSGNVQIKGLTLSNPKDLWDQALGGEKTSTQDQKKQLETFLSSDFWRDLETLELKDIYLPSFVTLEGIAYYFPPLDVRLYKEGPRSIQVEVGYQRNAPFLKAKVELTPEGQGKFDAQFDHWKVKLAPMLRIFKPIMHVLNQLPFISGRVEGVYDIWKNDLLSAKGTLNVHPQRIDVSQGITSKAHYVNLGQSTAAFEFKPQTLTLTQANVVVEGKKFELSGNLNLPPSDKKFSGTLNLSGILSLPFLEKVWPQNLAPKPRTWILNRMSNGHIQGATLNFGGKKGFSGTLGLEGFSVDYLPGMSKVVDVWGKAIFDAEHFFIEFSKGTLEQQRLVKGHIDIQGIDKKDQTFSSTLVFDGPLSDVLALVDQPPLEFLKPRNIKPQDFEGHAQTTLALDFPLESDLEMDQVRVKVDARLKGFSTRLQLGLKDKAELLIKEGTFSLAISNETLVLQGPALVEGQKATILWNERFGKTGKSRYELTYQLTPGLLKSLGLDVGDMLSGKAATSIIYETYAQQPDQGNLKIQSDLKEAAFHIPVLSLEKKKGEALALTTEVFLNPDETVDLKAVSLSGPNFNLEGHAKLSQKYYPLKITLDHFKAPGWDIAGQLTLKDKHYEAKFRGKKANLSFFFGNKDEKSKKQFLSIGDTLDIDIAVERVQGGYDQTAQNFRAKLQGKQYLESLEWRTVLVSGYLPTDSKPNAGDENGLFSIEWKSKGKGNTLWVRAYHAGNLLKFGNLHADVEGGELLITATRPTILDVFKGKFRMKNFRVLKMPTLLKLLSLASLDVFEFFSPQEGMRFKSLSADFSADTDSDILIHRARARNNSIGIFFQGTIKPEKDSLALQGSMVPAYMFYRILSYVPFLGDFLFGIHGRGLLATHFRVTGPLDSPEVQLNPLSGFTPGFFNKELEDPA